MKKHQLLVSVAALLFCTLLQAQTNMFMKLTDNDGKPIEGESVDKAYPKSVQVVSVLNSLQSCPTGTCKTNLSKITLQFKLDKAAIGLRKQMFTGLPLDKVEIYFQRVGSGPSQPFSYARIILEEAVITSITEVGSGDDAPGLEIKFAPARAGWGYQPQDASGKPGTELKTGWSFATNKEWTAF